MKKEPKPPLADDASLRRKAEALYRAKQQLIPEGTDADATRLIHELGVQKIEFELLNEALRVASDQAEVALHESEVRFHTLFSNAPLGYQSLDADGCFIEVNQQWLNILGYTKEEVTGKWFGDFLTPPSRDGFRQRFPLFKEQGEIHSEFEMVHKNGSIHFIAFDGKIGYDASGAFKQTHCILQDISERRFAEEALIESEAQLKFVLKSSGAGLWDWDMQTNLLKWSPELFLMFGLDPELDLATFENWDKVMHPDDKEAAYSKLNDSIANHLQLNNEYRVVHPDGKELWINAIGNTTYDRDGKAIRMAGICIDMTERKLADKTLHDIIEKNPISIQIVDKEGYTLQINAAHTRLFGAVPPPDYSIFKDKQIVNQGFIELFEGVKAGKSVKFPDFMFNVHHVYHEMPDKPIWLRLVIFPLLDSAGNQERYVLLHEDITERKQTEVALRESEERFKALHNASFGGITIHDKGIILECNRGLAEITGYDESELIGMDGLLLIAPSSRTMVMENIMSGYEKPYEAVGLRKNGDEYPIRLEGRNIPYKGKTARTVEFRDITEQKQAEETLKRSEETHRHLLQNLHAGVVVHAADTSILYANEQASRLLGLSHDQLMGKTAVDPAWHFVQEDCTTMPLEQYPVEYVIAHESPLRDQVLGIHRPETIGLVWVLVNAFPEFESDGSLGQIVVTFIDITERKQAEEALIHSEAKFREMADLLPQIVFESDLQGNLTYLNKQAYKLSGYSEQDELIGKSTLSFYIPEDRERAVENIKLCYTGNKNAESNEYTMIRKDGSTFHVLVYSNPIYKENTPVGLRGIIVDISEIKRTEAALQQAKEYAEQLIQAANVIIVGLDGDGNLCVFNETAETITGYSKADIHGRNWFEVLMPREKYPHVWDEFLRLMEGGVPATFENPILTKTGDERLISWQNSQLWEGSKMSGTISFGIDITERKQAEEKISNQLNELRRWNDAMLNREERVMDLKREVNELLIAEGKPIRYASVVNDGPVTE